MVAMTKKGRKTAKKKGSSRLKAGRGRINNVSAIKALRRVLANETMSRAMIGRFLGSIGGEQYDIDEECGYPKEVTPEACKEMFEREGIANRVVSCFPEECFSVEPFVYETEDMPSKAQTKFEKAWKKLWTKFKLAEKLRRADTVSGLGTYGIIIYGLDDGKPLDKPVCKINKKGDLVAIGGPYNLLWLQAYDETLAPVAEYDRDPRSYRYGLPIYYNVKFSDPAAMQQGVSVFKDTKVHWSRVIHIADNCTTSEVHGAPRMKMVFNYLLNIRKILGGSAEMLWKGGFPGVSFEVPPELAGEVDWDKESLEQELYRYFSGQKRYIATEGLHANSLNPNIADPTPAFQLQINAVCISMGIPVRVLMGVEEARLASIQDSESWNKKVHRRQNEHVGPRILRPLIDRFIVLGILPAPVKSEGEYFIHWPDLYAVSEADRASIAQKLVSALSEYETSGAKMIFPPLEFYTRILNFSTAEAETILEQAELQKKKMIKDGAIDKAGRPLPSEAEMKMQQAQMKVTLARATSQKAKQANNPRTRAQGTRQRAKTTGRRAA